MAFPFIQPFNSLESAFKVAKNCIKCSLVNEEITGRAIHLHV